LTRLIRQIDRDPVEQPNSHNTPNFAKLYFFHRIRFGSHNLQNQIRITQFAKLYFSAGSF
jgi:hypothetical protein